MFNAVHSSDAKQLKSAFEGAQLKLMVYGERMMLNHVELEAGACVTMHNHPNEQIGYCVSGAVELEVEGEKRVCRAGSAWIIPGGANHEATAIEPSVLVEAFSPLREDMIKA